MSNEVDFNKRVVPNFGATSAAFEAIALRCVGNSQGAADVLIALDPQSLAQVAYMLAGTTAQTAVTAHEGDGDAAAAQVSKWATLALHEVEMQQ